MSPQQEVAKDQAGESVKPLQAACLLGNVGAAAALLEANAFKVVWRIENSNWRHGLLSKQEDQGLLGILMKYAQEVGNLEPFMRELQAAPLQ